MSLPPRIEYLVPEETARVAWDIFPKGNLYMHWYETFEPCSGIRILLICFQLKVNLPCHRCGCVWCYCCNLRKGYQIGKLQKQSVRALTGNICCVWN